MTNIAAKLSTATLASTTDFSITGLEYYLLGDFIHTGTLGGMAALMWDGGLDEVEGLTQEDYGNAVLAYINDPEFNPMVAVKGFYIGSNNVNTVSTSNIANIIFTLESNDEIFADNARHIIDGGANSDYLNYINITGGTGVAVDLGAGFSFFMGDESDLSKVKDVFDNIENVRGSTYDDSLLGDSDSNQLIGGAGDDQLEGGAAHDVLYGGADNDDLYSDGDSSSDLLIGGTGSDVFSFGADGYGHDLIRDNGGTITIGGLTLSGSAQSHSGHWELSTGGELFTMYKYINELRIYNNDIPSDRITIEGFFKTTSGAFGFTLQNATHPATPHTKTEYIPPFHPSDDNPLAPPPAVTPGTDASTIADRFGDGQNLTSPLILDLGDDGFDIKGIDEVGVYFNLDADEPLEDTGWIGPDDGFLVIDNNSNGIVDDISELCGDANTGGFEALTLLDSNTDGYITSADSQWSSLRVWKDSDQDGETDGGELQTLSYHGITSINLSYTEVEQWEKDNKITEDGFFTMGGQQKKIVDIWFNTGQFSTIDDPDASGSGDVDVETFFLPHSRGFGSFSSLRVVMTSNETLMDMVKELSDSSPEDASTWDSQVEAIMFEWADVTAYSTTRGSMVDPRKLAFLEEMVGTSGQASPGPNASAFYTGLFDSFKAEIAARLLSTGPLSDLLPNAIYDYETDTLTIETDATALAQRIDASEVEDEDFWITAFTIIAKHYQDMGLTPATLYTFLDAQPEEKVGPYLEAAVSTGTGSGDLIKGDTANNIISGLAGIDTLYGYDGNDLLYGGTGNDLLYGGRGDDNYYVHLGDGSNDVIFDTQGENAIAFASGVVAADIRIITQSGGGTVDLFVYYGNGGDKIAIDGQYSGSTHENTGYVQSLVFADGTGISLIEALPLTGTSGNDTLEGTTGNDVLTGATGNDNIYGYAGNDTFYFTGGDGNDLIIDTSGTNVIRFGSGIEAEDIRLMRGTGFNDDQLWVYDGTGGDRVSVNGQFSISTQANVGYVNKILLADGTEIGLTDNMVLTGTSSNETLKGSTGAETLEGAAGNDLIYGYAGNDSYLFQGGDGNDTISDTSGTNVIRFGSGIDLEDIRLMRGTTSNDHALWVYDGTTGDRVTVNNQFTSDANNQ